MPTLEDVVAFIMATDASNLSVINDALSDRLDLEFGVASPEDMMGDLPLVPEEWIAAPVTEEGVAEETAPTLPITF